ncbi:UDP-N-acetylglucosamine 2-epimerase (non-hydrolyzing) [Candidatus Dependentiae bacterium]|nr:UDP-N-acetylglucosamine 2-epimerase (non-hydrolyzing) [Candidatus Dependentiae bacterium]
MQPIILIVGTRPEGIKMIPVYWSLKKLGLPVILCSTYQHSDLLDQVFEIFEVTPDISLNIMKADQDLAYVTNLVLLKTSEVFDSLKPSLVLVQGDTTTTFASALAAFYKSIPVGHIEAGLRTYDINNPFPEEFNRRAVSLFSRYNFVPTQTWYDSLINEGACKEHIYMTGNTVVDALHYILQKIENGKIKITTSVKELVDDCKLKNKKILLLTIHRRESFGQKMIHALKAIKKSLQSSDDFTIIFPKHPNPNVLKAIQESNILQEKNLVMTDSLNYSDLIFVMKNCDGIITDSGGIQEEAISLAKPVLILREKTERPEGVLTGCAKLVGLDPEKIYSEIKNMLHGFMFARAQGLYGDGHAAEKISEIIYNDLNLKLTKSNRLAKELS